MKLRNFITFFSLFWVSISFVLSNPVVLADSNTTEFSEWMSQSDGRNISSISEIQDSDQDCDCGPNSLSCEINYYDQKKCTCKNGYIAQKGKFGSDDTCAECDCGPNSISCRFNYFNDKKCECKSGYIVKKQLLGGDDTCKECNCGTYMASCDFNVIGFRQCTCKSGSVLVKGYNNMGDQKCVECDCGINAISCKLDYYDRKVCNCMYGYEMKSGDSECKHYGTGTLTHWKIGTIVISIIYSAIIVTLFVKLLVKHCDE